MFALLAAELRNAWNKLKSARTTDSRRWYLFGGLLIAFFISAEFLSYRLFNSFFAVGGVTMELIALVLVIRLLGLVFLVIIALLFFGAMIASVDALYFHEDIDFLGSKPISRWTILLKKFISIYWTSAWMVYLVVTPVMIGYGHALGRGVTHLILSIPALFLFTLTPVALASAVVIALMRVMPIDKAKEAVLGAGFLLSLGFVYLYRFLSPRRLFEVSNLTGDFTSFIQGLSVPAGSWLPSHRMAQALMTAVPMRYEDFWPHAGMLAVFGSVSLVVYFLVGIYLFETDRPISADASSPGFLERRFRLGALSRRLAGLFPSKTRGLVFKELVTNLRDPMQISHLVLIFSIVILHFANLSELPYDIHPSGRIMIAFLNLALVGFLTAGVAVRFVFPSVSLEGEMIWRIESAPISPSLFIGVKLLTGWVPLAVAAVGIVALSNWLVGIPFGLSAVWIYAAFLLSAVISFLGIGFGVNMPSLGKKNVFEISSSAGGIIFMLASLLYVGVVILLLVRPTHDAVFGAGSLLSWQNLLSLLVLTFISASLCRGAWSSAVSGFANFEERF